MLNKATIIGRLTKDPESKSLSSGSVANFTVAVDRTYKNKDGERETDFIPVVAWNKTAELVTRYLQKGSMLAVSGRIQTRSYDGTDGIRRYVTEIVAEEVHFLSPKSESSSPQKQYSNDGFDENFGVPLDGFAEIDDLDVPFS